MNLLGSSSLLLARTLAYASKHIIPTLSLHYRNAWMPALRRCKSSTQQCRLGAELWVHRPSLPAGKDPMHFCPRLDCRKWYHSSCLSVLKFVDATAPPSTRGIRLLAVDPDSEVPFVMFGHFCEPESRDIVPDSMEQVSVSVLHGRLAVVAWCSVLCC